MIHAKYAIALVLAIAPVYGESQGLLGMFKTHKKSSSEAGSEALARDASAPAPIAGALPPTVCPGDFGFGTNADFFWWQGSQDGLFYAFKNQNTTANYSVGPLVPFDFSWDPGFRLGFGWKAPYGGWDLAADWTWYVASTSNKATSPTGGSVGLSPIGNFLSTNTAPEPSYALAVSRWHLNHNLFDLALGRTVYLNEALFLRPFFGVRGGWLDRKWSVVFSGPGVQEQDLSTKSNQWGVGPRIGLGTQWALPMDFRLFGDVSTALLYGTQSGDTARTRIDDDGDAVAPFAYSGNYSSVLTNLQLFTGLGWGSCLYHDSMFLDLKLGWELLEWFNVGELDLLSHVVAPSSSLRTNVSLKGVTFSAKLDF